jgi:hypothetical protein
MPRIPVRPSPHLVRRLAPTLALAVGALTAGRAGAQAASAPRAASPRGAEPALTGVTVARLATLRWLEGDWLGRAADGSRFYERYRFVDDSTIQMSSFPDSTFTRRKDGDRIQLRGGVVRYENVVATRLDRSGIDFAAPTGRFGFTWRRRGRGWTATLWQVDSATTRVTVYELEPRARR